MSFNRNVSDAPLNPRKAWGSLRTTLQDLSQNTTALLGSMVPPRQPTNLKVTAIAFGAVVQFTPTDGDYSEVLAGNTKAIEQATVYNVGTSQQFTDSVGKSGVARYYWVRAVNQISPGSLIRSPAAGPATVTTLASGAAATIPPPPVAGDQLVLDQTTGFLVGANQAHNR